MNELTYNGLLIRNRGEMLCLTDMWKAAGSDPSKEPAAWQRSAQATEFIEFILGFLRISQDEAIQTVRGGRDPATWAHWQIGLAYAKYLSPEMHAQANTVWRAQIEGKLVPATVEEDRTKLLARALIEACKEIEENREDANAFRRISESEGSQNFTETAKLLRMKRDDLIKWLNKNRWIYRRAGNSEWLGYDYHTKNGDIEHVPVEIGPKNGKTRIVEQARITMQGIAKLAKIFGNIAA